MPRKPGRARVTGEHFTHRYLWSAAELLRGKGVRDADGGGILVMASMLFAYLALEAYLNDIGPHVCPTEWSNEKKSFGSGKYRGTLGKLELLLDTLSIPYNRGARPFQTIIELDSRRDTLVHGRTEKIDVVIEFKDPRALKDIDPAIYQFADESFLDRVLLDVESLCDSIQLEAQRSLGEDEIIHPRAFRGMVSHQGGSIIEMPS